MNLVFLYSARGRVPIDKPEKFPLAKLPVNYESNEPTSEHVKGTLSDSYPYMWENLLKQGIFEKITTVFETGSGWGTTYYSNNPNNKFCFIPHISETHKLIEPGDLVFVRGAWVWWRKDLNKIAENHHMVYYRGGRKIFKHWKWSVVLDDIYSNNFKDRFRHANIFYPKCINEEIFYPINKPEKKYDIILVGAIKKTKGQHRVMETLKKYRDLYHEDPSVCVLGTMIDPRQFKNLKKKYNLNKVTYKGSVSREELCEYYNASKLYVSQGTNEQGPRSTLEAIRCGIPILISELPTMWPHWQRESFFCKTVKYNDYEQAAKLMHEMLHTEYDNLAISRIYNKKSGLKQTCKMWQRLVTIVKAHPDPGPEIFVKEYIK